MVQPLGYNDGILLLSLLYSCVDLLWDWELFSTCSRPIHQWLLVSYACVVVFRLTHILGSRAAGLINPYDGGSAVELAGMGEFLLDLRHKTFLPRALTAFTWVLALPFFTAWTVIGTSWLRTIIQESPACGPTSTHLWFSGFWLFLSYVWIITHLAFGVIAWILEWRVRQAEGDLREIEDEDTVQRWGSVSNLSGYQALTGSATHRGGGLLPAEIKALPLEKSSIAGSKQASENECPICITEMKKGDSVRRLPACRHVFHRSCIDLWLLRRAECPMCKRDVSPKMDLQV